MGLRRWLVAAGIVGQAGCLALAGLDDEYSVGDVGGAGAGVGTAAGVGTGEGTSSTSTGGTSATGGSGGGSPVEDCLDGVDNDGNDLSDCADPACAAGYECVPLPAVPVGWEGYVTVDTTTYPAPSPLPCVDDSAPAVFFAGPGGAAQCTSCTCADPTGGSCTFPTMSRWKNQNDCSGTADDLFAPNDSACHVFPTNCGATCTNDQRLQLVTQSTLTGSPSCLPAGGAPTLPPRWTAEHHVCALPDGGGGCEVGQACVSRGGGFGGGCVRRDGAHACPGEFPHAVAAFAAATDDRDCAACSCDPGALACSGGSFVVSDDNDCQGGTDPDLTISGTTCTSARYLLDEYGGSYRAVAGTMSGACTPQGGQPTGSVTPSGPVTFCCL